MRNFDTLSEAINDLQGRGYRYDFNLKPSSALERSSEHPISVGIIKKVKDGKVVIPKPENLNTNSGKGVEATVEGKR